MLRFCFIINHYYENDYGFRKFPTIHQYRFTIRKSPYFDSTKRCGAKAFSIYNHMYMPTLYTSVVEEYWSMVNDVVMIDVAVERQIEISGPDAYAFVRTLILLGMCQIVIWANAIIFF